MCRNKPDSEFAALLKRHESHTAFVYGNAMNAEDLKLVAVSVLTFDILIFSAKPICSCDRVKDKGGFTYV